MNEIETGRAVFSTEIDALIDVKNSLDERFECIVNAIFNNKGKVIMTGMGKSGHIARKTAATFASLGIPAFFIHPAEAQHGDLGMIEEDDIVIMMSNSGNTEEIVALMSNIKMIGAKIIGITSGEDSFLAQNSDLCQILPKVREACALNLAPTSSTTMQLVYGDALAVAVSRCLGIDEDTFALYHPAGALGKRLVLKVKDAMKSPDSAAVVTMPASFRDVIVEMCEKESRIISLVDEQNKLKGIITDGDIRRILKDTDSINEIRVEALMTRNPVCVKMDTLLVDVFSHMREKNINGFPVVKEDGTLCGCIEYNNIIQKGIG